jgi:hypothetical protein
MSKMPPRIEILECADGKFHIKESEVDNWLNAEVRGGGDKKSPLYFLLII